MLFGAIKIHPVGFFADETLEFLALFSTHAACRCIEGGKTIFKCNFAKAMDKMRRQHELMRWQF